MDSTAAAPVAKLPQMQDPSGAVQVKVTYGGATRRFKLHISNFKKDQLPTLLKSLLDIPAEQEIAISRYSTASHGIIALDSAHAYHRCRHSIYAKSKAKLFVEDVPTPDADGSAPAEEVKDMSLSVADIRKLVKSEIAAVSERIKSELKVELSASQALREKPEEIQPMRNVVVSEVASVYSVRCDICSAQIEKETYYHCKICKDGDYDVCSRCVKSGFHCLDDTHYLAAVSATVSPETEVKAEVKTEVKNSESKCPYVRSLAGGKKAHNAYCDGCDKDITGTRYKCVRCPDFDYCGKCFENVNQTHPSHTFVALEDPSAYKIAEQGRVKPAHYGILCDGPGCVDGQKCIYGTRYKCAICEDYDLCENCESLPKNGHDESHPMIMLKTPRRHITVAVADGAVVAEEKAEKVVEAVRESVNLISLSSENVVETRKVEREVEREVEKGEELDAQFVYQMVADKTVFRPGQVFYQSWSMKNNGRISWPAGVTLTFVGGQGMSVEKENSSVSIIPFDIEVGETARFTAMLRAPNENGTYISYWRMVTAEGERFGDNLWCEVKVERAEEVEGEQEDEMSKSKYSDASDILFPVLNVRSSAGSSVIAHADEETTVTESEVTGSSRSVGENEEEEEEEEFDEFSDEDFELVEDSEGSAF